MSEITEDEFWEDPVHMNLKKPCGEMCPFRRDCLPGWLGHDRAKGIALALEDGAVFSCHKTVNYDDDDEPNRSTSNHEHCAGAMLTLMKEGRENTWMQVAERLGYWDRSRMEDEGNTFDNLDEFIEHHTEERWRT